MESELNCMVQSFLTDPDSSYLVLGTVPEDAKR
jgi:hypothetical protein